MNLIYDNYELTLQDIMDSNSELEYITSEQNIVPLMISNELKGRKLYRANYRHCVLFRKTSVDYLMGIGYNLFQQSESESVLNYFDRPIAKKDDNDANVTERHTMVTSLGYDFHVFLLHLPNTFSDSLETRSSLMHASSSSDSRGAVAALWSRHGIPFFTMFHPSGRSISSFPMNNLEDYQNVCQSTKIVTNTQRNKARGTELPPGNASMVWSRKYCDSRIQFALKLDHFDHCRQEYDRIRESGPRVIDCLMNRQTHGPLNQRRVLEVIAGPYYNIYPPADKEEERPLNESVGSENENWNFVQYALLSIDLRRSFKSYPYEL